MLNYYGSVDVVFEGDNINTPVYFNIITEDEDDFEDDFETLKYKITLLQGEITSDPSYSVTNSEYTYITEKHRIIWNIDENLVLEELNNMI